MIPGTPATTHIWRQPYVCPTNPTTGKKPIDEYDASVLFFFQAEDGIRDYKVTGVQTCALPIFSPTVSPEVVWAMSRCKVRVSTTGRSRKPTIRSPGWSPEPSAGVSFITSTT